MYSGSALEQHCQSLHHYLSSEAPGCIAVLRTDRHVRDFVSRVGIKTLCGGSRCWCKKVLLSWSASLCMYNIPHTLTGGMILKFSKSVSSIVMKAVWRSAAGDRDS